MLLRSGRRDRNVLLVANDDGEVARGHGRRDAIFRARRVLSLDRRYFRRVRFRRVLRRDLA